ncbi:MAG: ankyrin repeat domain-containing protein [Candidatus Binatia bacterium]
MGAQKSGVLVLQLMQVMRTSGLRLPKYSASAGTKGNVRISCIRQWKGYNLSNEVIRDMGLKQREEAFLDSIRKRNVEEVAAFLAQGVSPDLTDARGRPALVLATLAGSLGVVMVLLRAGADVNASTAAPTDNSSWEDVGKTALMVAAEDQQGAIVRALLDADADVNQRDFIGATALWYAATGNDVEIIRPLIRSGARVNAKAIIGGTALTVAAGSHNNLPIVKLLLGTGGRVDAKDEKGRTALWWAEYKHHDDVANLLRTAEDEYARTSWLARCLLDLVTWTQLRSLSSRERQARERRQGPQAAAQPTVLEWLFEGVDLRGIVRLPSHRIWRLFHGYAFVGLVVTAGLYLFLPANASVTQEVGVPLFNFGIAVALFVAGGFCLWLENSGWLPAPVLLILHAAGVLLRMFGAICAVLASITTPWESAASYFWSWITR